MLSALFLASTLFLNPQVNYTAQRSLEDGIPIVVLADRQTQTEVRIVPSLGNRIYRMTVAGQEILWNPNKSLAEFKAQPAFMGVPLMAPWANRLEGDYFHANGKKYPLHAEWKNFRRDGFGHPIHGLLSYAPEWSLVSLTADAQAAEMVARLDFWRYPHYMGQFPLAHEIELTYRLSGGALEVRTTITNRSAENLPIGLGYHPYFQLPGTPRESWQVTLPVNRRVLLSKELLPTGESQPYDRKFLPQLGDTSLDDVFTDLDFDASGQAEFRVEGGGRRISVVFGRRYPVAVAYAPKDRPFICFEPMTAITNAFNLAHEGRYPELQTLPPGQIWKESFWIRVSEVPSR